MANNQMSRRDFLKTTAAAAGLLLLPKHADAKILQAHFSGLPALDEFPDAEPPVPAAFGHFRHSIRHRQTFGKGVRHAGSAHDLHKRDRAPMRIPELRDPGQKVPAALQDESQGVPQQIHEEAMSAVPEAGGAFPGAGAPFRGKI